MAERQRREAPTNPVPPKPAYASPIDWWKLDEVGRAEVMLVLGQWVPQLVRRYVLRDSEVPPCWYRHEAMVQELLALYQYRNQQQVLPTAPPSAMLDFHVQFQHAILRLRSNVASTGCNTAEHFEDRPQGFSIPGSVEAARWRVEFDELMSSRLEAMSEVDPTVEGDERNES